MTADNRQSEESKGHAVQRRSTAYHEAGHAVMALVVGRPVEKVTISPGQLVAGGRRLGACKIQKGRTKPSKDAVEASVLILLAGMVAESRVTGRYDQQGAAQDLFMVKDLLTANRARTEKQFQKLARRMIDKTEHILREPGPTKAIQLVAAALLENETISGRAARHLFETAQRS